MWAGSRSKLLKLTCLILYETVRPRKVSWPLSPIPMYTCRCQGLKYDVQRALTSPFLYGVLYRGKKNQGEKSGRSRGVFYFCVNPFPEDIIANDINDINWLYNQKTKSEAYVPCRCQACLRWSTLIPVREAWGQVSKPKNFGYFPFSSPLWKWMKLPSSFSVPELPCWCEFHWEVSRMDCHRAQVNAHLQSCYKACGKRKLSIPHFMKRF